MPTTSYITHTHTPPPPLPPPTTTHAGDWRARVLRSLCCERSHSTRVCYNVATVAAHGGDGQAESGAVQAGPDALLPAIT